MQPVGQPAFQPGITVYAQAAVRVRQTPGYVGKDESDTLLGLNPGQPATILGPTEARDGLTWWQVGVLQPDGTTVEGWAAQATADALLLAMSQPRGAARGAATELLG